MDRPSPSPISRRSSRVRFSETGRPTSLVSASSSSSGGNRRSSSYIPDSTSAQARRLSRPSSEYVRAASPSDFAPRHLPMPRYNGPPAQSYAADLRKSTSTRSCSSTNALSASLEAHRLSVPDLSRSYSTESSAASSVGDSSRRSSARFSILSDPQDLDMLASLGGVPDIDEFFINALSPTKGSRPLSISDDLMVSPPPTLALPSPGQTSPAPVLNPKPTAFVTPTIPARARISRALSPIHGEDEATPIVRPLPVFPIDESPMEPSPAFTDATPLAGRHGRLGSLTTPLMAFPIPPPRAISFESVNSALIDEIDKPVDSELQVVSSMPAGVLQPAPIMSTGSSTGTTNLESNVADDLADSPTSPAEAFCDARPVSPDFTASETEYVSEEEAGDDAIPPQSEEEYEPSEAVTDDADDEEVEALPDAGPSSPSISDLMSQLRLSRTRDIDCYEDDEPDYEIPLYEATVRAGILSSRSQLIWPSKPKRRTFIPPRLVVPVTQSETSGTGWSGSESEEEEFNAVLMSIGQRKLAQRAFRRQSTPARRNRSSLRLSMMSESSTSSASSIELLTPDPHRTTFSMGPYDPLNPTTPSSIKLWSTKKAPAGSALGIPIPTRPTRKTSFTRALPAPKRSIKGWGKPEVLLEDDEAPLIHSSSEEEDHNSLERSNTITPRSIGRKLVDQVQSPHGGLTMLRIDGDADVDTAGEADDDGWLMDETEPEFIAGEFTLHVPPTRHLGVPF